LRRGIAIGYSLFLLLMYLTVHHKRLSQFLYQH
jgi:hypothetical protein